MNNSTMNGHRPQVHATSPGGFSFRKATKEQSRLRMALIGVAGSGKTYTALSIARHLGQPVAVIDTERGSASKYSDLFDFDVLELDSFSPLTYVEAIHAAAAAGYKVLIIDSLSHAWIGHEGALAQVDRAAKRSQSNSSFGAWREVTPMHNAMVDAILAANLHVIVTMRAKTEYVQEKNEKTGKTQVRKVGTQPVQRDGLEYEFDVVCDLDQDNNLIVGKTRCPALTGAVFERAGSDVATILNEWLTTGAAPAPEPPSTKISQIDDADPEDDSNTHHCHCAIEARRVVGKSGAGFICGHNPPRCQFKLKEAPPATAAETPAPADPPTAAAQPNAAQPLRGSYTEIAAQQQIRAAEAQAQAAAQSQADTGAREAAQIESELDEAMQAALTADEPAAEPVAEPAPPHIKRLVQTLIRDHQDPGREAAMLAWINSVGTELTWPRINSLDDLTASQVDELARRSAPAGITGELLW